MENGAVAWRVRAIRGATTVEENTVAAMESAVTELLDELEARNTLPPDAIISATFSVTRDLDAIFPAAVARHRPGWSAVPLLDVQHMYVSNSLPCCIRLLLHVQVPANVEISHIYLRKARALRPDLDVASVG